MASRDVSVLGRDDRFGQVDSRATTPRRRALRRLRDVAAGMNAEVLGVPAPGAEAEPPRADALSLDRRR
jgi:hypothetical protein